MNVRIPDAYLQFKPSNFEKLMTSQKKKKNNLNYSYNVFEYYSYKYSRMNFYTAIVNLLKILILMINKRRILNYN